MRNILFKDIVLKTRRGISIFSILLKRYHLSKLASLNVNNSFYYNNSNMLLIN